MCYSSAVELSSLASSEESSKADEQHIRINSNEITLFLK
jgi:hypothetical protein